MTALDDVLPALCCPVCRAVLTRQTDVLTRQTDVLGCRAGHRFDIARQGYANLAVGRAHPGTGDSAPMVAARGAFLGGAAFAPVDAAVAEALVVAVPETSAHLVVDLAGGTGQHLARVLPGATRGLVVDLSAAALRRAARVRPDRIAAIGADVWGVLPVRDGAASAVLSVFGPRHPGEVARLLAPAGVFVVVSPRPDHLRELIEPLGLITVDAAKSRRQSTSFADFTTVAVRTVSYGMDLDRRDVLAVAAMGPSARHVTADELAVRVAELPERLEVTASVDVRVYTP